MIAYYQTELFAILRHFFSYEEARLIYHTEFEDYC